MKNYFYYLMAMLCLKIARFNRDMDSWAYWMDKSIDWISKLRL